MKYREILLGFFFFTLNCFSLQAQPNNSYSIQWKKIEQLEKKGLTQDASREVLAIFDAATRSGNQAQRVKAAMYLMKYRNIVQEDNRENNIFYLDTLIAKTKTPGRNILQSMKAELLQAYREQNRYRLYDRTRLVEENSSDIRTWSIAKLNATISAMYKASLENEKTLKLTKLDGLDAILIKGKNSETLRPTLYDFLAHRALQYFMSSENDVSSPAFKFILNDEKVFAPLKEFVGAKFITKDTSSLYLNALLLIQDLLAFHLQDGNVDALLDADLTRLAFINEHAVFPNKSALYEAALVNIEKNYGTHAFAARAKLLRAREYMQRGAVYHPVSANQFQFAVKDARALAQEIVLKFPKTASAAGARNMIAQIETPFVNLETEKVNVPGEAFRTLVKYKNVPILYFRVVKTSRDELKSIENRGYEKLWPALTNLSAWKSWSVGLPDKEDFQQHSTEIKVEGLAAGTYMLLSSLRSDFGLSDNIIARQIFYVSNISYIYNGKREVYVLNRTTGTPLANAEIQVWEQKYDYTSRTNEIAKREKYTADKNGLVRTAQVANRYNNFLQIRYNNEELFTNDSYYSYSHDSYRGQSQKRSFLFTDRSIYRPGQTVFFKGIVVNTDTTGRKSSLLNDYSTTVILFDANNQKVASLKLSTNEYGSFTGNFQLPEGILNGQFYIRDSINNSQQEISVEEYKRPKFSIDLKKPTGTYRVNDMVTVTGNAKAYAGNSIDGAKVSYRVVRRIQYPIWWGWTEGRKSWPPYGQRESMEVSNGETVTDANGDFNITFKAIPDETVDKKAQPKFYYEVSAEVTDINGETRSGMVSVAVAYQALQLSINALDRIPADSVNSIRVTSNNINGLFERATVRFEMYKLDEPARLFRKRYWEVPDQFIMTKEQYHASFPYDVYANEDQPQTWSAGKKEIDVTDTTSTNGKFFTNSSPMPAGYYKLVITTRDKYNEEVTAEKFIRIFDSRNPAMQQPATVVVADKILQPGEKLSYAIHTGFDKIWLIENLEGSTAKSATSFAQISSGRPHSKEQNVTEDDRGGISINYAFVKHNRVYFGTESIAVPWSNKDLKLSYETFRDKLLPGAAEKWTVKITGNKGEKIAAEMLVSMYDASLDQYRSHSWQPLKSIWPVNGTPIHWVNNNFTAIHSEEYNNRRQRYEDENPVTYDALLNSGWNEGYYGRDLYMRGNAVSAPTADAALGAVKISTESITVSQQNKSVGRERNEESPAMDTTGGGLINVPVGNSPTVQIRKNLNETAFFFPSLVTDDKGNISFSFTIPEALTQWKLMTVAHDKQLASAYSEQTITTQKPLMVQPNAPRFFREGDRMELVTKVVNMGENEMTGTAQLELFNTVTNTPVDGWFKNVFPTQYFTVAAGRSVNVKFPIDVPFNYNSALTYRIKAIVKDGSFSDGEEAVLPVFTNRVLVTETLPMNLRNTNGKTFRFDKLLASANSESLSNHGLTVEYTTNPAWYAVQALPYLTAVPIESADQNFNRYYANMLASFIAGSTPKLRAIFDRWKNVDTAALLSNLQKNQELKSALLEETPWVLDAKTENEQKKNIAILFDMVRLSKEKASSITNLREMQSSNGGFTWFKGGPDDRYITQYIITGIGRLRKLNALTGGDYAAVKTIADKGLPYLDARLRDEYNQLLKSKVKLETNNLSTTAVQYLYMRSFFPETPVAATAKTAVAYYKTQAGKYWNSQNKFMQAMIAVALHRNKDMTVAKGIVASLKQNAIYSEELGMYFKESVNAGYYWYQAPVEGQTMVIEAFSEIDGNVKTIDDLKTWLLKQKQTQNWGSSKATADAIYALLLSGSNWLAEQKTVDITLAGQPIATYVGTRANQPTEAGTGFFKQRIDGNKVRPELGNIAVTLQSAPASGGSTGTTWGAAYWQYFEDIDKVTSAATPLSIVKKIYVEKKSDRGLVLQELKEGDELKVGDKLKVRLELRVDRNMEYVHLKDSRAAALEPINVISQYKWQGGLGYYESTRDASTNFFFSYLPRGTFIFEYALFVSHKGNFSSGLATIQSLYAPQFSSHSNGTRLSVE